MNVMDDLFTQVLSGDQNEFEFHKKLVCQVAEEDLPSMMYGHTKWETTIYPAVSAEFEQSLQKNDSKVQAKARLAPASLPQDNGTRPEAVDSKVSTPDSSEAVSGDSIDSGLHVTTSEDSLPTISEASLLEGLRENATRQTMAACTIPEIACGVTMSSLQLIGRPSATTKPLHLERRPPQGVVDAAFKLLHQGSASFPGSVIDVENTKSDSLQCVAIPQMGVFDETGLGVLRRFCVIAKVKRDVASEVK